MPYSPMATIKGLGVAAIEMAHASGQCWLASFNYQMIVIVHEAIGMAAPRVSIDTLCQQLEKIQSVDPINNYIRPAIAPRCKVIQSPWKLDA